MFCVLNLDKIDCSAGRICHLAWVIRNKKLGEKVLGKCSNGTFFGIDRWAKRSQSKHTTTKPPKIIGLNENGFKHCPERNRDKYPV